MASKALRTLKTFQGFLLELRLNVNKKIAIKFTILKKSPPTCYACYGGELYLPEIAMEFPVWAIPKTGEQILNIVPGFSSQVHHPSLIPVLFEYRILMFRPFPSTAFPSHSSLFEAKSGMSTQYFP